MSIYSTPVLHISLSSSDLPLSYCQLREGIHIPNSSPMDGMHLSLLDAGVLLVRDGIQGEAVALAAVRTRTLPSLKMSVVSRTVELGGTGSMAEGGEGWEKVVVAAWLRLPGGEVEGARAREWCCRCWMGSECDFEVLEAFLEAGRDKKADYGGYFHWDSGACCSTGSHTPEKLACLTYPNCPHSFESPDLLDVGS
ncbi:hypothetical protein K458DRAFT_388533 [Lentithecium fluviatile CBS 122367]|uniref:Uncharacterized protein n=1 Tax=Lentithecium fluviatile CBS 122367 TaxID=1168545 RepID=A0A6G1J2U0_9PLEO|nr:hypothetical protein K458DRAFT_388533 [Lentithecium fluviatile CBS 122367]